MWPQPLSRPSRHFRNGRRSRRVPGVLSRPICDAQTGFIHHAPGCPLEFKRVWFDGRYSRDDTESATAEIGLIFESEDYVKPGSVLEITITPRGEETRFRGKVVLVRKCEGYFEIGVWMHHAADASRVRIIEQICHIDSYMQERKYRDGPYNLNHDRIAAEWIMDNAGTVPRL